MVLCELVYVSLHPVLGVLEGLLPLHCDCSSKPCSQATQSPGNTHMVHRKETSTMKGRGEEEMESTPPSVVFDYLYPLNTSSPQN